MPLCNSVKVGSQSDQMQLGSGYQYFTGRDWLSDLYVQLLVYATPLGKIGESDFPASTSKDKGSSRIW